MRKIKVALVGAGGISQVVRIPYLKKFDEVELVALCDADEAKVSFVAEKFKIDRVYFDIQNLLNQEKLDGIFICTPNNLHYPMALAALEKGIVTLVEKPIALNTRRATRLKEKVEESKTQLIVGMNNRFRSDAIILKNFLEQNELGKPFYMKCGWLKKWSKQVQLGWLADTKISGGGVIMDMGIQLIDLALWLIGKPQVKGVRSYCYNIFSEGDAEDSALVILETKENVTITIEVAWRLHLERDVNYTNIFGAEGAAFLNPLRLHKDLHGNMVNVTPMQAESNVDMFKNAFENELKNFIDVVKGEAEPVTPVEDGVYIMKIIDAIYKSAKTGKHIVMGD